MRRQTGWRARGRAQPGRHRSQPPARSSRLRPPQSRNVIAAAQAATDAQQGLRRLDNWSAEAKAAWASAPEPLKAEVARTVTDFEKNGIRQYQEQWEPLPQFGRRRPRARHVDTGDAGQLPADRQRPALRKHRSSRRMDRPHVALPAPTCRRYAAIMGQKPDEGSRRRIAAFSSLSSTSAIWSSRLAVRQACWCAPARDGCAELRDRGRRQHAALRGTFRDHGAPDRHRLGRRCRERVRTGGADEPRPVQTQAPPANAAQTSRPVLRLIPGTARQGCLYQAPRRRLEPAQPCATPGHWTRLWITPWAHPASNINRHRRA